MSLDFFTRLLKCPASTFFTSNLEKFYEQTAELPKLALVAAQFRADFDGASLSRHEFNMLVHGNDLTQSAKDKSAIPPIKLSVARVNRVMDIRGHQNQIRKIVLTASAQPMNVVCLTKINAVSEARIPAGDLANPVIKLPKFSHQLPIPLYYGFIEIALAGFSNTGFFQRNKSPHRFRVASPDSGFELFFRQDSGSWLGWESACESSENPMIRFF